MSLKSRLAFGFGAGALAVASLGYIAVEQAATGSAGGGVATFDYVDKREAQRIERVRVAEDARIAREELLSSSKRAFAEHRRAEAESKRVTAEIRAILHGTILPIEGGTHDGTGTLGTPAVLVGRPAEGIVDATGIDAVSVPSVNEQGEPLADTVALRVGASDAPSVGEQNTNDEAVSLEQENDDLMAILMTLMEVAC